MNYMEAQTCIESLSSSNSRGPNWHLMVNHFHYIAWATKYFCNDHIEINPSYKLGGNCWDNCTRIGSSPCTTLDYKKDCVKAFCYQARPLLFTLWLSHLRTSWQFLTRRKKTRASCTTGAREINYFASYRVI